MRMIINHNVVIVNYSRRPKKCWDTRLGERKKGTEVVELNKSMLSNLITDFRQPFMKASYYRVNDVLYVQVETGRMFLGKYRTYDGTWSLIFDNLLWKLPIIGYCSICCPQGLWGKINVIDWLSGERRTVTTVCAGWDWKDVSWKIPYIWRELGCERIQYSTVLVVLPSRLRVVNTVRKQH